MISDSESDSDGSQVIDLSDSESDDMVVSPREIHHVLPSEAKICRSWKRHVTIEAPKAKGGKC